MREIEKNFKNISHLDWIYFDDFLKSISVSFGKYEPFVLRNKGKKWKYIIPEYTENEKKFIYHVVCEKLHEAGMVKLGFHKGRLCLKVTDFGYGTLCE